MLIQTLLNNCHPDDLRERIAEAIPVGSDRSAAMAGQILADAVEKCQAAGLLDPAHLYFAVCSSTAAQLADFLQGTSSADISRRMLPAAQIVLTEALTSKAGRKKTSDLTRNEQLAAAQSRRREKVKSEGRKRIDVWLTPAAASFLDAIQSTHACESQAEALEKVLAAAMNGEILTPPYA
jgi:hypothetical protein